MESRSQLTKPAGAAPFGYRVLGGEALERLHGAGLEVLERVGVQVRDERALEDLARAGARVEGLRARIPAGLVEQALASAPGSFVLAGRAADGSLDLDVRPGSNFFSNGTDCLYVRDVATGERRRAMLADGEMIAAGCELLSDIDFVMSSVLPADAPLERVDLAQFAAMLKGTRKPIVIAPATAGGSLGDMLEMAELAGRRDSFGVLAMTNPPLVLDGSCLGKARACGAAGVPFISAPGSQMGATGPASVAGSLAVGHAETLAALVVHQLGAPGAPFLYGTGAATTFDMRNLIDVWSTPEGRMADTASCQLATSLGLPSWSFAGISEAKTLDGQWAAETAMTIVAAAQMGASLLHDVGEYELGMQYSLESLIFSDAVVGYARRLMAGFEVDDATLQLDDIEAVGPGGSYLGRAYTRRHYRDSWGSPLFDTTTHEHWVEGGSETLADRLREAALDLIDRREPVLDGVVEERLDGFWRGARGG
jgi:trimethylamine--corrinoid protein Co-methyltransferase